VGPDGNLYTIWDDRDGIVMAISSDEGRRFSKDRRVIEAGPGYFGIAGVARSNGFPQIGIDPRLPSPRARGKHHRDEKNPGGNLYVAWSDYANGDVDAFVASSS